MKTFKRLSTVLLSAMMLFVLVACSNKSIVGTWSTTDDSDIEYTFIFNKDGTGSLDLSGVTISFEYTVKDDTIVLTMTLLGTTEDDEFTYELSGNKLTLTDQTDTTIQLQKQ